MANKEQVAILKQGAEVWNKWRKENRPAGINLEKADLSGTALRAANLSHAHLDIADLRNADLRGANLFKAHLHHTDLSGADLREADLSGAVLIGAVLSRADLSRANLISADLREANLEKADLSGTALRAANLISADLRNADLRNADLSGAILEKADFSGANLEKAYLGGTTLISADLREANLREANLREANLNGANLSNANLSGATLVGTDLTKSVLTGCKVYGISAWDLMLEGAEQSSLVITQFDQPTVTVSNLKVAQFLYLLIHNPEIRDVLDTITSKVVLILGRFTDERLSILEALRTELQKRDYIPVLFDFDAPKSRHIEETVSTLAHMAKFIIADITDPRAIPQELTIIVRNLQMVPVLPLLHGSAEPWGMFASISRRSTVLPILEYSSESELIGKIQSEVIEVAEKKVIELKP